VIASPHFHFEHDAESRIFAVRLHGIITDKIFRARMFQMTSPAGRDMLRIVRSMTDAYAALGVTTPHCERLPDGAEQNR